jgi:hypothetical protein
MEGKEWVWDNGVVKEQDISEIQQEIERAKQHQLAEKQTAAFEKFMRKVAK